MKRSIHFLAAAALIVAAASCSSVGKMAELADNVNVKCTPAVLEAVAGTVPADVTVTYPKNYFHPKAILEVVPVIVYEGGEVAATPLMYQGEKVKDNYKPVAKSGGIVNEKIVFPFKPGMEQSHMELRGTVRYKAKTYTLPVKKVADGVNTTYMLVDADGSLPLKADGYQAIIKQTEEGQILYNVNSAEVRSGQINGQSIKNFQKGHSLNHG